MYGHCAYTPAISSIQPVLLGLQCGGDRQVPAAGLTRDDHLRDAERLTIGDRPPRTAGTIVQPGGERVRSERTGRVAELDADDDHAGRREVVAPADVVRIGRLEDGHATTMGVHDARHRSVDRVGSVDVEIDVVAIDALDHLGVRRDAGNRGGLGNDHRTECVEADLGLDAVREQLIDRVGGRDR